MGKIDWGRRNFVLTRFCRIMQRIIVVALCVATLSIFLDHVNLMPTNAVEKAGEGKQNSPKDQPSANNAAGNKIKTDDSKKAKEVIENKEEDSANQKKFCGCCSCRKDESMKKKEKKENPSPQNCCCKRYRKPSELKHKPMKEFHPFASEADQYESEEEQEEDKEDEEEDKLYKQSLHEDDEKRSTSTGESMMGQNVVGNEQKLTGVGVPLSTDQGTD